MRHPNVCNKIISHPSSISINQSLNGVAWMGATTQIIFCDMHHLTQAENLSQGKAFVDSKKVVEK
jgi:hypothetical protein